MQQNHTAVIKQDTEWWIGWIEEIPGVNCHEQSREALVENAASHTTRSTGTQSKKALGAAGGNFEVIC